MYLCPLCFSHRPWHAQTRDGWRTLLIANGLEPFLFFLRKTRLWQRHCPWDREEWLEREITETTSRTTYPKNQAYGEHKGMRRSWALRAELYNWVGMSWASILHIHKKILMTQSHSKLVFLNSLILELVISWVSQNFYQNYQSSGSCNCTFLSSLQNLHEL